MFLFNGFVKCTAVATIEWKAFSAKLLERMPSRLKSKIVTGSKDV